MRYASASLPEPQLFRDACRRGLSVVRPLADAARDSDAGGWNFGRGWPPSYEAYGRMRALTTLKLAASLKPRRLLEVAAGDAALSASIVRDGASACANDLRGDELRAALARFRNGSLIEVLPGNVFDLDPARIGLFDLIAACEVIEHMAHPVAFLSHLKRFLEPGGRILLTTPNGAYFRNPLPTYSEIENETDLEARQFRPDADGHLFLITPAELSAIAAKAALEIERVELCATPFITGHCRFASMRSEFGAGAFYMMEKLCQRLPAAAKEKICYSMIAILR
jgi:2-polyprenyl-3-methyl-5-hydroxy-6-metoxy-1,4-benzoquinol methylase